MKLALALLLVSAVAHADKESAKPFYEASKRHFDLGEWDAAIESLKKAHHEHPDPAYLFNIAQAERLKGDCLAAHDQYKAFTRESTATEVQRNYAEGFVKELAPCAMRRRAELEEARRIAAMPVPVERRRPGLRTAGWISLGVGAAAMIASGVFLAKADSASADVARALAERPVMWTDELEDRERSGQRANAIGIVSGVIGGAALIGGGVIWWLGRTRIETVVIDPRAGGATAGVSWRW